MGRYFVLLRDCKINVKTVFGVTVFSIFMFPGLATALQTARVRTSGGEVYQIHFSFSTQDSVQNPIRDFSIYDATGRVKICLDWYEKEGEAGQRWRPIGAELWTAAEILARTPRRTRVFDTSSLANSLNEAAAELMPTVKDQAEKELAGKIISEIASHTPLEVLNIGPKSGPAAVIAVPVNFISKLGTIELKMRRLLYAFWLAYGYADSAIQLQEHANQRAKQLWDAINAGKIVNIFGGKLNLDGKSGEMRGDMSIDGPLRLRLVAEVYQDTAEKAAKLGVGLGKSEKSWTDWLVGLTGVGDLVGLLKEVGGALKTKGALEQLYDSLGDKIEGSLRRDVEGVYDSAYSFYKGGFCEPGVDVLVDYADNTVDEGSGFTYTVVLKTQPDRNVTINVSSDNADVTVLPTSRTFTRSDWYKPKTFKVRTAVDTDGVSDRVRIKHAVRGYGNITSANEVLVIVVDRDPVIIGELPEQVLAMSVSSKLDLSKYFRDPDGDTLKYTVIASDKSVVTMRVVGARLTIIPKRLGRTKVVVRADPRGNAQSDTWEQETFVTVKQTSQPPDSNMRVGDAIIVQNTLDIGLSIRGGAGTAWNSKGKAFDGATGTITDGPVSKNGYTWWRVRWNASNSVVWTNRPTNNQGWSVEALPEEGVSLIVPMPDFPDLVVESNRVNKSSLAPGEGFTLSTTVRNAGTGRSTATKVRCYQSADASVSTDDRQIEIADIGALSAGVTRNKNFRITAPDVPGTYYYGVCVDGVQNESATANNCSRTIAVTVQAPALPDLVVASISASSNVVGPGENFTLFVTVRNQGTAGSLPTALSYHDPNGGQIGTARIGRLSPSEVSEQNLIVRAPDRVGTYYYDACVESPLRSDESDLDNNCSVELAITVGTPTNRVPVADGRIPTQTLVAGAARQVDVSIYFRDPDGDRLTYSASSDNRNIAMASASRDIVTITPLRVGNTTVSVTASDGRLTATQRFTVEVQSGQTTQPTQTTQPIQPVQTTHPTNQPPAAIGTVTPLTLTVNGAAQRVNLSSYFRDSDGDSLTYTARSDNTTVATVRVSVSEVTITPSQSAGSTTIHVTASDGHLSATQSISITVADAPPVQDPTSFDLAIQSATVSKSTVAPSESFTLSITIHNSGPAASGAASLSCYYSFIQGRTPEDQVNWDGKVEVGSVASGESTTKSFRLNAPATPRTYYYGALLTTNNGDTNIFNNVATEVGVTVRTVQAPDVPDFVIQSIQVNDDTLEPGERFTFYATVVNKGKGPAHSSTTLRYYRSTDAHISTHDTEVDTDSVNPLYLNEKTKVWDSLRVPNSSGTYYYGVCVDSVDGESNTRNNCSAAIAITVRASEPDLVVESDRVSDDTVEVGERFTFYATVKNQGNGEARRTTLRYYRSSDSTISDRDTEEDTNSVSSLDANETSEERVTITAPNQSGIYYYGVCVDNVTGENDTNNNCSTGIRVTVADAIIVRPRGLSRGDSIVVQNASGGGLNGLIVRSGAGIGFKHIISVFNGATGTITDGPKSANGYTWWKVSWDRSDQVFCDVNPCMGWVFESFRGTKVIAEDDALAAPLLNAVIPTETVLLSNYPNPFNPETWLPYQLAEPAEVSISIYAADGKLVRMLDLGHQPAGIYQSRSRAAYWDGRNAFGESVASGVYFYTLIAGDFSATRKMLIRK